MLVPSRHGDSRRGVIVVDIGCASYASADGQEDSIITLLHRFKPLLLWGFDPYPEMRDGAGNMLGALVMTRRAAAWTHDGKISLALGRNTSHVSDVGEPVACFDLAAWLKTLPRLET